MTDKFKCQYGIKKVVIEIEVDELRASEDIKTYGDALAEVLIDMSSVIYHTDAIGEVMPIVGVKLTELDENNEKHN